MSDVTFRRGRFSQIAALGALVALAACQTNKPADVLDVNQGAEEEFTEADLRAYCPRVTLRDGTAYLTRYTSGNDGNADEVVYQATITDVTRTCKYRNGQLFMTVAAAGRVINGPKGSGGDITMPIRVAITEGESVPYSRLGQFTVTVVPGAGASQFIYKDDQIVLPEPQTRGFIVFTGFDEGPYDTD